MSFFQKEFLNTLGCIFIICLAGCQGRDIQEPDLKKQWGTAIIITGAAAKIPQEAALIERLYKTGSLKDVVFISGASSGSINLVVLSAILDHKLTWSNYKEMLFGITNDSIFIQYNSKIPVDTEPLHKFLIRIFNDSLGYRKIADLPYPSAISIVNLKILDFSERTYRMSNFKINPESDPALDLVDVIMASCSYPLAFPAQHIRNVTTIPDDEYIDGGIAADHVPFQAVIEFEKYRNLRVEKLIIVSRKRDTIPDVGEELKQFGIDNFELLDKLGISLEDISRGGFIKRLKAIQEEAPVLAKRTFVYIPDFPEIFYMFDFNNSKEQYLVTEKWSCTHNPIPLEDYLKDK